jgi:hypothetical protein
VWLRPTVFFLDDTIHTAELVEQQVGFTVALVVVTYVVNDCNKGMESAVGIVR